MNSQKTFIFKSHKADFARGEIWFNYVLQENGRSMDFVEKISFPSVTDIRVPQAMIDRILDGLLLMLGISYWKMYCSKNIVLNSVSLTEKQADFWNTVYTQGLGEFYYRNKIDFRGLVKFPFVRKEIVPFDAPGNAGSLLGIGGGKDSIVSAELLRENNKDFDVITSGFAVQKEVTALIGRKTINAVREVDPKLLEMVKQKDVYNGHVPISVYYAFLMVLMAVLFDYKYVIVSNEKSANYGNVEYLGTVVNHQWSKSLEFEKLFQDYVTEYITKDISYFSLLRPLSEIKIVEIFAKYKKYFSVFSSCNTNFRLRQNTNLNWCGKCAKCIFVFGMLSAFVSKEELVGIFGKNLYADGGNLPIFEELLGIKDFKPFECVGTPGEMKLAMYLAQKKEIYNNDVNMKMFMDKVLPQVTDIDSLKRDLLGVSSESLIPEEFRPIINSL